MISLKIREKETEKTVRRAIKICQDKEKSRKSIQSLLSIMATERHLILVLSISLDTFYSNKNYATRKI